MRHHLVGSSLPSDAGDPAPGAGCRPLRLRTGPATSPRQEAAEHLAAHVPHHRQLVQRVRGLLASLVQTLALAMLGRQFLRRTDS
ncbi:hypothetical protein EF911_03230 [Streptomyces sp. WAC06128]|nr:hypothetical protein EF911_03230 [Streptomyces sp. WAC06128]